MLILFPLPLFHFHNLSFPHSLSLSLSLSPSLSISLPHSLSLSLSPKQSCSHSRSVANRSLRSHKWFSYLMGKKQLVVAFFHRQSKEEVKLIKLSEVKEYKWSLPDQENCARINPRCPLTSPGTPRSPTPMSASTIRQVWTYSRSCYLKNSLASSAFDGLTGPRQGEYKFKVG